MKKCFVLLSCLVLAGVGLAAAKDDPQKGKKKATAVQRNAVAAQQGGAAQGNRRAAKGFKRYSAQQGAATQGIQQPQTVHQQKFKGGGHHVQGQTNVSANVSQHNVAVQRSGNVNRFHTRRFTLANRSRPEIASVRFSAGRHIQGSERWQGRNYDAFRSYRAQWHDRDWWRSRHNRIVFVYGAPYFWDSGWWYPAWGYDPNANYAYDGPIYGYNELPPDQVVANVQAALQEQGYYTGEVDGLLGPLTRAALARYQQDHGLYTTSAIDEPTLASLGMS